MEGQIKLVDGPTLNEGRVMINYKQHHGAVCADRFNINDANTVCHQLGFAGQERITGCCPYGRRTYGVIWLDELGCSSRDVWLANCTHRGWGVHDCHNGQEIGLKCNREFTHSFKHTIQFRPLYLCPSICFMGTLIHTHLHIHSIISIGAGYVTAHKDKN